MGFYWCKKFSDFIGELELMDIPLGGGAFTWTGGLRGQSMSRPDCFCMQSLKIKTNYSELWRHNVNLSQKKT